MGAHEDVAAIQADQARLDRQTKAHAYEVHRLRRKWEAKVKMAEAAKIAARDAGSAYARAQSRHTLLAKEKPQLRRDADRPGPH